eukprot:TRINITY_DN13275_c0_g1_i1.p1 TRINITY_DN13275_c0_g1~~TRINITY_DN13275_c0_g1_i1.p1  ORF type:complete len:148 (-),score=15.35 TRINITY_DN13275_c0_g1_i1:138-581(-)
MQSTSSHPCSGNDLGTPKTARTAQECCQFCEQEPKCVGFTWGTSSCYLKSSIRQERPFQRAISGKKKVAEPQPQPQSQSQPGQLSGGTIFSIVIACVIVSYLVVGILWNRVKNNERGLDLIPNKEVWSIFFGLVLEGLLFTWKKISS